MIQGEIIRTKAKAAVVGKEYKKQIRDIEDAEYCSSKDAWVSGGSKKE